MQLIVAFVVISIILSGCNPYKFEKIGAGSQLKPGYHILRRNAFIDELVIDEKGNHPVDLPVAKERFKRRRKTVEKWYKRYYPFALEGNPFIVSVKSFFSLFFLPLIWVVIALHEPSEKELEKQGRKYANADAEMQKYIEQDCKKEYLLKERLIP